MDCLPPFHCSRNILLSSHTCSYSCLSALQEGTEAGAADNLLLTPSAPPLPDLSKLYTSPSDTTTNSCESPTMANSSAPVQPTINEMLNNKLSSEASGGSSTASGGSSGRQQSSTRRGAVQAKGAARGRAFPQHAFNQDSYPPMPAAPAMVHGNFFTMPWTHPVNQAPHHFKSGPFAPYVGATPAFGTEGPPSPPSGPSPRTLACQKATAPTPNPAPTTTASVGVNSLVPSPAGPTLTQQAQVSTSMGCGGAILPWAMYPQQAGFGNGIGCNTGCAPAWGQGYPMVHPAFARPAGGFRG